MSNNNKAAQIEYWYIVGFNAAILILSFTSMPVVFTTARDWFGSMGMGPTIVMIGANVITMAYYLSVELLISILLPYAAGEITSTRMKSYERKKKRYIRAVLAVGFMLTAVSMSMSYFFSQDAAAKLSKAPDISPFQQIQETQSKDFSAILQSIESDLSEARKTEKKRVAAAIASGPEKWQQLYKERNAWFLKQRGKVGEYLATIKAEQEKASKLEAQKAQLFTSGTQNKDEIINIAGSVLQAEVLAATADKNLKQATLFIIACGAGVVALVFAFILGWHRDAEGTQVEDAPMSPAMMISRLFGKAWRGVSDSVADRYELSFAGATSQATGATSEKTSSGNSSSNGTSSASDDDENDVSDKGSRPSSQYIDMRRDIDRIRRSLGYNWKQWQETNKPEYKTKVSDILSDNKRGVAWLSSLGFDCSFDWTTGKFSVQEPK